MNRFNAALLAGALAAAPLAQAEEAYTTRDLNEQLVMATLWMQASAEFRALSHQAFNVAHMQLDKALAAHKGNKPLAIAVDVDETILDNTAYEAYLIGNDFGYSSKTWVPWMNAAEATAMPGAVEFLNYAASKGVHVFYITNRKEAGKEGTLRNLKALGFPYVDETHLLMRVKSSSKEARRQAVLEKYDVALMMGDNLNDFSDDFYKKSVDERFAATDKHKDKWGTEWIVLPNPTYGAWEGAVYNGNWKASAAEKDQMRKQHLRRWAPKQ